jgi:hypothetical protein
MQKRTFIFTFDEKIKEKITLQDLLHMAILRAIDVKMSMDINKTTFLKEDYSPISRKVTEAFDSGLEFKKDKDGNFFFSFDIKI